jgi:magnesium chelatase subunit D
VVDNSYSVHAERMVEKVKGLAFRLLEDSAHRGDKVALVAFKGGLPEATIALPLTRSRALALRRLRAIPISGRTPLADALERARRLLRQERFKHENAVPVLVAVTDGLPTVPLRPGGDPLADVLAEGRALRRARVGCIVVDASRPGAAAQASCGLKLAQASGGVWLPLTELAPGLFDELDVMRLT